MSDDFDDDRFVMRHADPRAADAARIARDIQVAGAIGSLTKAVEVTNQAVQENNRLLCEHIREQRTEDRVLRQEIEAEMRAMRAEFAAEIKPIKKDIAELQDIHKREDAEDAQVKRWVKVAYALFGGAVSAGLLSALAWAKSIVVTAQAIRPAYLAMAAVAAAWAILFAASAHAATYYVTQAGSDSAAGTISAPWRTLTYAATRVTAGDIVVAEGTFSESVRATISGQPGNPIVYRAKQPGAAKIVPPPSSASAAAWEQAGSYVTIEGFEIDGAAHQSGTRWTHGIRIRGAQHVTATQNVVRNIGRLASCTTDAGYGIGADADAAYITIAANTVSDIGPTCAAPPPVQGAVWSDEFNELSIAGVNPNAVWFPWFKGWNVHALDANGEKGWKDYDENTSWNANGGAKLSIKQIIEAYDPPPAVKARYLHEVSGGTLKLRCYPNGIPERDEIWGYSHSCGMISSEEVPGRAYATGYWEVRMRINSLTKGHHLAIWLVPQDSTAYPPEIDIGEWVNTPSTHHMNIHGESPIDEMTWDSGIADPNGWKTYGLEITPTKIRWYRDGSLRRESNNNFVTEELNNQPAQPLAFMISPEMVGNWPGPADGTTVWPFEAEIDHVRYFTSKP